MGVVVGLLLGAGVACIWWSFWAQPAGAAPTRAAGWHARTQDALVQDGRSFRVKVGTSLTRWSISACMASKE